MLPELPCSDEDVEETMRKLQSSLHTEKEALVQALKRHSTFVCTQSEMQRLATQFDILKQDCFSLNDKLRQILPGMTTSERITMHVSNQLKEALALHSQCSYLLELHKSTVATGKAVDALWRCIRKTRHGIASGHVYEVANDFNERAYRTCIDQVIKLFEETQALLTKPVGFNKEMVAVFRSIHHAFSNCKGHLDNLINTLWRRWLSVTVFSGADDPGTQVIGCPVSRNNAAYDRSVSSDNQKETPHHLLFGCTKPSMHEIYRHLVTTNCDVSRCSPATVTGGGPGVDRKPRQLARLSVYARPLLLIDLFRLASAVAGAKGRLVEFTLQIWHHLFEPWLSSPLSAKTPSNRPTDKTTDVNGYSADSKEWLVFQTEYVTNVVPDKHTVGGDPSDSLLPCWQLNLLAPICGQVANGNLASKEKETDRVSLLPESCHQLSAVLEQLHNHLYSLPVPVGEGHSIPLIDMIAPHNSEAVICFDELLANRLLTGRFTSAIPSTLSPPVDGEGNSIEFILPTTQAVCHLIGVGQDTGFFRKDRGAALIRQWLHQLPSKVRRDRSEWLLASARRLFADGHLLSTTTYIGSDDTKENRHRMPFIINGNIDNGSPSSRKRPLVVPSLMQLLESSDLRQQDGCNQESDSHFDASLFYFPSCEISETIPRLLHELKEFLKTTDETINRRLQELSISDEVHVRNSDELNPDRTDKSTDNGIADSNQTVRHECILQLAETSVELIPRVLFMYTSLVPMLHPVAFRTDLRTAALYYNNCFFLAYECLTFGELHLRPLAEKVCRLKEDFASSDTTMDTSSSTAMFDMLERSAAVSTCILVPHLRAAGTSCLGDHLRRTQDELLLTLKVASTFREAGSPEGMSNSNKAAENFCQHIERITEALKVLPSAVSIRCLSILCNAVCAEVVTLIMDLVDISEADCNQLLKVSRLLLNKICSCLGLSIEKMKMEETTSRLIQHYLPDMMRLHGLATFLSAASISLIERELWRGGTGPLAVDCYLKASEVRDLIKAVYATSALRSTVLAAIVEPT